MNNHRPDVNGTPVAGNHEVPAIRLPAVKREATFELVMT
jgi:hypothetical protein